MEIAIARCEAALVRQDKRATVDPPYFLVGFRQVLVLSGDPAAKTIDVVFEPRDFIMLKQGATRSNIYRGWLCSEIPQSLRCALRQIEPCRR